MLICLVCNKKKCQQITGDPQGQVTLAEYAFDDLGNVISKKTHDNKEETTCAFDIAGRNISATSPSFSYKIGFDKSLITGVTGRVDRLISQVTWSNSTAGDQKGYVYTYNKLGQLTNAQYREKSGSTWLNATNKFREVTTYNTNGNILTMQRYNSSATSMHNYTYTYGHATNGNALTRVSGLSVDCNAVSPIAIKFDVRWRHAEMLNSGTTFKDSWSGGYENVSGHFG